VKENQDAIQQELRRTLATPVSSADLAQKIAALLASLGRRVGIRVVAQRLGEDLASRFTHKSAALQRLIKYRSKELAALADLAAWDEIKTEVLPIIEGQQKVCPKVKKAEERLRRKKRSKNRYEQLERSYVTKVGVIEREFSTKSVLLWLDPAPPTGPCLDAIFQGGKYKMSGAVDSLQWLFGLRRKRLSTARPAIREGREICYDYRGVLACMDALLKQTGPNAYWLPDPARRQQVIFGVLFRALQEAKPKIRDAFGKTLLPHLT
jgi:hypothetical protein